MSQHLKVARVHRLFFLFFIVLSSLLFAVGADYVIVLIGYVLCAFHAAVAQGACKRKLLAKKSSNVFAFAILISFPVGTFFAMYLIGNSWDVEEKDIDTRLILS